jgi:hypothetical protein
LFLKRSRLELRAKERRGMAFSCRKSEIKLSLPYEQPCVFAFQDRCSRLRDANFGEKGQGKIFSEKIQRKPLISLDSEERIQGNPRKSNGQESGFSQRIGGQPRKTKLTALTKGYSSSSPGSGLALAPGIT